MKKTAEDAAVPPSPDTAKKPGVPMLDLSRQYASIRDEVNEAVLRVCASQQYILGKEVEDFESEAAAFIGCQEAIGCASGTDAIWLSLMASNIGPGDEVITSPFSFFASASTIIRTGAKPVFVDVESETLNLDPRTVEARITQSNSWRLKALVPVHIYGQCANMDALNRIAKQYKMTVIEDAAQAFGAAWRGRRAGDLAPVAAFSFYPTKNLSCYGDGGLVTTSSPEIADRIRLLRNHGSRRRYYHDELGWNSRLDAIQAAVLRVKLKYLKDWNAKRVERAGAYDLLLKSAGLLGSKSKQGPVRLLARTPESYHIFHQYVVRVERRDALRDFLAQRNIGSETYYPVPLHLQKCFMYLGYHTGDMPNAELAASEVMALPMFPELTSDEQSMVVDAISEFFS